MNILIVEDDDAIRDVTQQALELAGYSVLTAANGQEALKVLASNEPPCLILLDLMMPVMDGWEFLTRKINLRAAAQVPVVAFSAFNEKTRPVSCNGFIKKPIDLDVLFQTVQKYCAQAQLQQAAS